MATKLIYGQPWINKETTGLDQDNNPIYRYDLVQEIITFETGKPETTKTSTIVEDIWDDLTESTNNHLYKVNKSGDYFYWEYSFTDLDDNLNTGGKFECPRPIEGVFDDYDVDEDTDGEYATFWKTRLKTATENYEKSSVVQRKEVVFPGCSYTNYSTGAIETLNNITYTNTDLGDITNLLNLF